MQPTLNQPVQADIDNLIDIFPSGVESEQNQLLPYENTPSTLSPFTGRTVSEADNINNFLPDLANNDYPTPTAMTTYQTDTIQSSEFHNQYQSTSDYSEQLYSQMGCLNHSLKSQRLYNTQLSYENSRLKSENQLLQRKCTDLNNEKQMLSQKNSTLEQQLKEERSRTSQLSAMQNKIKAIDRNVNTLGSHVVEITKRFTSQFEHPPENTRPEITTKQKLSTVDETEGSSEDQKTLEPCIELSAQLTAMIAEANSEGISTEVLLTGYSWNGDKPTLESLKHSEMVNESAVAEYFQDGESLFSRLGPVQTYRQAKFFENVVLAGSIKIFFKDTPNFSNKARLIEVSTGETLLNWLKKVSYQAHTFPDEPCTRLVLHWTNLSLLVAQKRAMNDSNNSLELVNWQEEINRQPQRKRRTQEDQDPTYNRPVKRGKQKK